KWQCAEHHAAGVIRRVLDEGIPPGIVINVNFPDCEPDAVRGIAVTAQGRRAQEMLAVDARVDGRGNPYFWIAFAKQPSTPGNGTDLWAIKDNRISVTPLRIDMTDEPTMTRLAQAIGEQA
ncbi:MAG TPA: 5'/3'-nucleotidase SurE, partial [Beijerinckiaceae bacterium]|nr:5'/3'-nucleotidase SurE [Beijerinckiaceae bacterium]